MNGQSGDVVVNCRMQPRGGNHRLMLGNLRDCGGRTAGHFDTDQIERLALRGIFAHAGVLRTYDLSGKPPSPIRQLTTDPINSDLNK